MEGNHSELQHKFRDQFGKEDLVVEAPGRINIIGEHTDYNDGFVLPAAIDKFVTVIIKKSGSNVCNIIAYDIDEEYSFTISKEHQKDGIGWANYFIGVLVGIQQKYGQLEGFNMMFSSTIPIGSGLSSSAAIECGFGFAISNLFDLDIGDTELAEIGQRAEHEYAGVQCGIMDQFAVVMGRKDQVIKLDCRTLEYDLYPADFGEYELILFDTQVKHNLASSEYNIRRSQCQEGVKIVNKLYPEVISLRDVTLDMLHEAKADMDDLIFRRCKYVIEENERVLSVCEELKYNNIEKVGELMYETHLGLSNNYQVSCAELDLLVDLAKETGKIIGARMMGGGFGGCTINLVESKTASEVVESISDEYRRRMNKEIKVYPVSISDGVRLATEDQIK